MSKITKWKTEKSKVKVVFRLQFHATQVPQTGWDKLFVSFAPADTRNVIAKTTKANVRNGSCKWSDPIYETTRLLQNPKTKIYDDKLYKLVVAMGSSRSGILGDATINLADYVDAAKPLSTSLPLQRCNLGTVLHVTVQLLTSKTGFREFEQQRELRERGIQTLTGQNVQDEADSKVVSAKVGFKSNTDFLSVEEDVDMNEGDADSAVVDGSSYTSESLYIEKRDTSNTSSNHENRGGMSTLSGSNAVYKGADQLSPQGSSDWIQGWCDDVSLAAAHQENSQLRTILEVAESSIADLQLEIVDLRAWADEMAAEIQRSSKQLVAEIASGEELSKHISVLKLECSRFKDEFEKFRQHNTADDDCSIEFANQLDTVGLCYEQSIMIDKEYKCNQRDTLLPTVNFENDVVENHSPHDLEVDWLHNMFLLEDKIKAMKQMTCRNKEQDLGLLQDLESLECLTASLKRGSKKLICSLNMERTAIRAHNELVDPGDGLSETFPFLQKPSEAPGSRKSDGLISMNNLVSAQNLLLVDVERYAGEGPFHHSTMLSAMPIELDTYSSEEMKGQIREISKELEAYKIESSNFEIKMNQMESYYKTLIHDLEESQQLMQAELQTVKDEHCSCLRTLEALENQAQKMQNEKSDLHARFFVEKHALDSLHVEAEKRAVTAETALKRLRQSYCMATDLLLKDLETLSGQVLSMFEANEEVARQSIAGAIDHCLEEAEEIFPSKDMLHHESLWSKEQCETKANGTWIGDFLMNKKERRLLQKNTLSEKLTCNIELKRSHDGQNLDTCSNHSPDAHELQQSSEGICAKMSYLLEERKMDSDHSITLNKGGNSMLVTLEQLDNDQVLHINHGKLIEKQLKVLSPTNAILCQKDEILMPVSSPKPVLECSEEKHLILMQGDTDQSCANRLSDSERKIFYLEIFSLVLMQTVQRAETDIVVTRGKQRELTQQLERSTKLKDLLIVKLQDSSKRVKLLQENDVKNNVRHDELVMKNNSLEAMLQDLLKEKNLVVEKLKEREMWVMDLVKYKDKYETCIVEIKELKSSIEERNVGKVKDENEIMSLKENLSALRQELAEESSIRIDKEKSIDLLQYNLANLKRKMCALHEMIADRTSVIDETEKLDGKNRWEYIFDLEKLHREAQGKFLQLLEEKKEADEQLKLAQSQMAVIKVKTKREVELLKLQLEESHENSERLQTELVNMTEMHMLLTETTEKYTVEQRKLSSELAMVKVEMQSICEEKENLAKKVVDLEGSCQGLDNTKLSLSNAISENKALKVSLDSSNEALTKQMAEIISLKETVQILEDELMNAAKCKDKVEAELANSTSQFNDKQCMFLKRQSQLEFIIEEGKLSLSMAEKFLAKSEDELCEMQMLYLYFEIFSLVSAETLKSTLVQNVALNKDNEQLVGQIGRFIGLEGQFTFQLQSALDKVKIMQENEARNKAISEGLIFRNTVLEKTLQELLEEKSQFAEKLRVYEMMALEYDSHKQKYDTCIAEKEDLQRLLEKTKLEMVMLNNEVAALKEHLTLLTIDLGIESSKRDEQDRIVASMQNRLQDLRKAMFPFSTSSIFETNGINISSRLDIEDVETTVARVEHFQREVCEKLLICYEEKKKIEEEHDLAQRSLRYAESQVLYLKESSELGMKLLTENLDESTAKLEKLGAELVDLTNKLKVASEMEKTHAKDNMKLSDELSELKVVLQSVKEENRGLLKKMNSSNEFDLLKENLRTLKLDLERVSCERDEQDKLVALIYGKLHELSKIMLSFGENEPFETSLSGELDRKDILSTMSCLEELQHKALHKFLICCQENKEINEDREIAQNALLHAESQVLFLKERSEMYVKILMKKLEESSARLNQLTVELVNMTIQFAVLSETEEMHLQENMGLSVELSILKIVLEYVQEYNINFLKNLASSIDVVGHNERIIHDYMSENEKLTTSLQSAKDESVKNMEELDHMKEDFICFQEEVHFLRKSKDDLENALTLITYELNEKHEQLVSLTEQKAEFLHLKQLVSDLSAENYTLSSLLLHFEENERKLTEYTKSAEEEVMVFDYDMDTLHRLLLQAVIDVVVLKTQVPSQMAELLNQISVLQEHIMELQTMLLPTAMTLDNGSGTESLFHEQNVCLILDPLSFKLGIDVVAKLKGHLKIGEKGPSLASFKDELQHLNVIVMCLEELENLKACRDELGITNTILFSKFDELSNHILFLDRDELIKLRVQNSELTERLSEQVLKAEEFRNLAIHLQELKDKTDITTCNDIKTADMPSFATQESLRIAFIREQSETKLHDLRSQLYSSRKHSEELLLKLQIALDELEALKKSETAYARKSEGLSMRVHELEAELQSVVNEVREKAKDYNQLKTELEVSTLSLMCCKEEKENLEISLQECQNERTKLSIELTAATEQLENPIECQPQQGFTVGGLLAKQKSKLISFSNISTMDPLNSLEKDVMDVLLGGNLETSPALLNQGYCTSPTLHKQSSQGNIEPMGFSPKNSGLMVTHIDDQVKDADQDVQYPSRQFKEKTLFSSMERLQKELERMKNENLGPLLDRKVCHPGLVYEELFQREMLQLNMANEQLLHIFPQFSEFLESGNALERVLALEMELAEALRSKKKDAVHFHSSFLKQHNDEEAIFKSFRDINELIKDMVELKRKNVTIETELMEMHNRYSQLSVQFAEVEGERQKLVMTLKNIRSPRKL